MFPHSALESPACSLLDRRMQNLFQGKKTKKKKSGAGGETLFSRTEDSSGTLTYSWLLICWRLPHSRCPITTFTSSRKDLYLSYTMLYLTWSTHRLPVAPLIASAIVRRKFDITIFGRRSIARFGDPFASSTRPYSFGFSFT